MRLHRRELLGGAAFLLIGGAAGARAQWLPWRPEAGSPPAPFVKGPWIFFDPAEGAAVEALVDRLIPPDPETPGGKDAGCAVFIDRQLAGPYGRRAGLYVSPPFIKGTKQQGPQDEDGPAEQLPQGVGCARPILQDSQGRRVRFAQRRGQGRRHWRPRERRREARQRRWPGVLRAPPQKRAGGIFRRPDLRRQSRHVRVAHDRLPGARYDYRDWVNRHNERYPRPPVSLEGRADWNARKT